MSILDLTGVALDNTVEPTVMKAGEEEKLRVVNMIEGTDKNQVRYIMPFFESVNDPYCKEFGDYLPLPHDGMGPKDLNKAKLRIADFFSAFGIDASKPIDVEADVKGKEGYAIVGMGKDKDDQPVNKINKYVKGR